MKKTIVTIADTHALHKDVEIPDGDILLCGGDFTNVGKLKDVESFNEFIGQFSHEHKVTIAGNHDFCFEKMRQRSKDLLTNCTYLHDSEIEIDGIKIYGSPWQPEFFDWAFNLKRGKELEEKWAKIPDDVDILITHGPPMGILDCTLRDRTHVGCQDLLNRINEIKPKVHIFGHIHEGYGTYENDSTLFINASVCTLQYNPVNKPIVFIYDTEDGTVKLQDQFNG